MNSIHLHRIAKDAGRIAGVLLASLALLAPSRAAAADEQPAVLTLIVNEVKHGEVVVMLDGGDVLVPPADLAATGLHDLHGRTESVMGRPHIRLSTVPPLRFAFDERALTLRITVPPELLPTSVVDMRPTPPTDIVSSRSPSGFLNYSVMLSDFRAASGFLEAGLSLDGALLSSTVAVSTVNGVTRGVTSLVVDDRADLQRWTLGDSFVSSGELGAGLFVGGISVTKSFAIDPYFIYKPSLGYSGSASTPSTLEVYVDGALVRSQKLAPGLFRVENLPVATGSGNVRYLIRDAFGRQQVVNLPYVAAERQLAEGQSEYTYSLGAQRQNVGQASFDYKQPGFLGHHRVGVTNTVTLGGRLEASRELLSGGPSVSVLLPFGQIGLSAAASACPGGPGLAGSASFGFMSPTFGVAAAVRAVSRHYATLSLGAADDRSLLDASATTSVAAGPRVTIAARYGLLIPRDAPAQFRLGASLSVEFSRELHLNIAASRSAGGAPFAAPVEASAVLAYSFGGGFTASAGGGITPAGPEASADFARPVPASNGAGFRVAATAGPMPRASAVGRYQSLFGHYGASVDLDASGLHTSLEASGALVAVAGAGVFVAPPIQNGFAVIRVPGVKGIRGYLDNRDVGATDADGDLFVPNLVPYYGNRLRIADHDLPLDYSVDGGEILLSPPLRGGAVAVFSVKRTVFYRGRVVIKDGATEAAPSYGELTISIGGAAASSPLGKEGEFELSDVPPGEHRARVAWGGEVCQFELNAPPPSGKGPIVELGDVECAR